MGVTNYAYDPTFAEQFGAAAGKWELDVAGAETQGREGAKTQEGNAAARVDYGIPLNQSGDSHYRVRQAVTGVDFANGDNVLKAGLESQPVQGVREQRRDWLDHLTPIR